MGARVPPSRQPPPEHLAPMLATLGTMPSEDEQWAYEMKWDGVRAVVHVVDGRVKIMSRNDRDVSVSYPELQPLGAAVRRTAILDGEIVSFDPHGRPSFGRLQQRMHVADVTAAHRLAQETPAVYLAFDLLYLDRELLLESSYLERRQRLEALGLAGPSWQTPPAFDGSGAAAVRASRQQRLEGVVAKRRGSRYLPGRRSPDWVKVKNIRTQEVVIGGWKPGNGRRAGTIGSLLLGIPSGQGLGFVGGVGTGFTDAALADLYRRLSRLARDTSPLDGVPRLDARDAHWVRPQLVGEVTFTEWTEDGRLRHPSWRGLRPDKEVDEVVREE
jgi:bifunctional non-homologous end joining protein LigD